MTSLLSVVVNVRNKLLAVEFHTVRFDCYAQPVKIYVYILSPSTIVIEVDNICVAAKDDGHISNISYNTQHARKYDYWQVKNTFRLDYRTCDN